MKPLLRFKKIKIGYCSICSEYKNLTEDHVPPKSCYNDSKIEIFSKFQQLFTRSNNGLKFKSLCSKCNNEVLSAYDNELGEFVKKISNYLRIKYINKLQIPSLLVSIDQIKIFKSIVGHLISSFLDTKDLLNPTENYQDHHYQLLRNLFLDKDKTKRKYIKLYYWIYKSPEIEVMHNISFFLNISNSKDISFLSYIKFYPIGFMLIDSNHSQRIEFRNTPYFQLTDRDTHQTEIDITKIPILQKEYPMVAFGSKSVMFLNSNKGLRTNHSRKIVRPNEVYD